MRQIIILLLVLIGIAACGSEGEPLENQIALTQTVMAIQQTQTVIAWSPTPKPTIKPTRTPKPSPTVEPSPTVASTEQLILGDWLQEADGGASVFRFGKGGAFVGCTIFSGGKSLSNGSWDVQGDIVHTKFTFKVFSSFGVDDDGREYDWYYEFIDENTIAPTVNRKLLLIRVDNGIYEACMES